MSRHIRCALALCLCALATHEPHAQPVLRPPDAKASLEARWVWAGSEARSRQHAWIGYGIWRMRSRAVFGDRSANGAGRSTLSALIDGTAAQVPSPSPDGRRAGRVEELGILFRLDREGIAEVAVSSMTSHVDLKGGPLFWLGEAGDAESMALLERLYDRAGRAPYREGLVTAAGVHDDVAYVLPFLERVLASRENDGIREVAAFWLGQIDAPRALDLLKEAVRKDPSQRVREHAVFAISQMELEAATDELVRLARGAGDPGVRKQAIFWLAQHASERAVATLKDAVFTPGDADVQKHAVFALSQLPNEQGFPLLVDVARTHADREVRKQAIFWIGQSDDPRAVDVLVEMVQRP